MKSMCINEVSSGVLAYADRIAMDDNNPLTLLIAAEDEDEHEINAYPHSSSIAWAIV